MEVVETEGMTSTFQVLYIQCTATMHCTTRGMILPVIRWICLTKDLCSEKRQSSES